VLRVKLRHLPAWNARRVRHARHYTTGVHYPLPTHPLPAYRDLGYGEGAFPVAARASREVLSLPVEPGLSEAQVEQVAGAMTSFG